jgi:uncharacterized protein YndB with AHSA1/START domain
MMDIPAQSAGAVRAIAVEEDLDAAPETVWRALTQSDLFARWLMPNDFVPMVGHRFTFRTEPVPGFDGVVHCQVVEVTAPKRLQMTWAGGALDTIVTFTLAPLGSGTRLRIEQNGFSEQNVMVAGILEKGWRRMSGTLSALVADLK